MAITVALLGAVDSGKTTFFKVFTGAKVREKKEITQELRFKTTKIEQSNVLLVDLPGHDLFAAEKSIALTICDFIIYVADYNNPNLTILSKFDIKKPVIVLLNKVDLHFKEKEVKPLQVLCKQPSGINDLYNLYDTFCKKTTQINLNKPFLYFLDICDIEALTSNILVFPVALKENWGTKEFSKFLKNYVFKNLNKKKQSYLYLKDPVKNTYLYMGDSSEAEKKCIVVNDVVYELKDMKYNRVSKQYFLPAFLAKELNKSAILKLYDASQRQDLKTGEKESSISVAVAQINEVATLADLQKTLKTYDSVTKDLVIELFGQKWEKAELFMRVFEKLSLKYVVLRDPGLNTQDLKDSRIRINWLEERSKLKLKKHPLVCNSSNLYEIIDFLLAHLKTRTEKKQNQKNEKLKCFVLIRLLHQSIFKNYRKDLVIGGELLSGTIKLDSKEEYFMVDQNLKPLQKVKILSLQSNKKEHRLWTDCEQSFALKLNLEQPYDERIAFLVPVKDYKKIPSYVRYLKDCKKQNSADAQMICRRLYASNLGHILKSHDEVL